MHDPGGKVRTRVVGMGAGASFCMHGPECHRLWLTRSWGEIGVRPVMFIGMNPSTADAEVNDPTVTREIGFAKRWGYTSYVKVNVMDYRATHPKDLLKAGVEPCSAANLGVIRANAEIASMIIACWGNINHPRLRCHVFNVRQVLREVGKPVYCFGLNKGGDPVHSLYQPLDAQRVPYSLEMQL